MNYKKNYKEVIERLTKFYNREDLSRIYAIMNVTNPALKQYSLETQDGKVDYPNLNDRIKLWDNICKHYVDLEDDSLPIAYMSELDEGLYGGLVGGHVELLNSKDTAWISSMTVPFVEDIEELLKLELPDENNIWFKRYLNQLEIFKKHSKDNFGISHFIMIDGLNFLFELRGATNAYYDVLEEYDTAKKVFDFAKKLNHLVQDLYFEKIGLLEGGTISNMLQYCPGKIVSESLDPYHLGSKEFFLEYGKEYIEEVTSHYDGFVTHIHGNGYDHLIEEAAKLKNIKGMYLLDDEYTPYAMTKIDKIHQWRQDVPIIVTIQYEEFMEKLNSNSLYGNILYNVLNVPSIEAANNAMKLVKAYKAK